LIPLIFIGALIVYVYKKNPVNVLNRLFIWFLLLLFVWAGSELLLSVVKSEETAKFVTRLGAFGWNFIAPSFLLFTLAFVRNFRLLRHFWFNVFLGGVPLFLMFFIWRTDLITNYEFIHTKWGWTSLPGDLFFVYGLWIGGLFLFSFFQLFSFYSNSNIKEEKQQALLVALSLTPGFLLGMTSQIVFPLFGFFPGVFDSVIFPLTSFSLPVFIGFAIFRYKLFVASPSLITHQIIDTMRESLFVLSPTLYIEFGNKAFFDLLGYGRDEIIGKRVDNIIVGGKEYEMFLSRGIKPLTKGTEVRNLDIKLLTKAGKEIPVNFSASPVSVSRGVVTGIVVVVYDASEIKRLIYSLEVRVRELQEAKISLERALGNHLS